MQMDFDLPKVNEKETKIKVESEFEKYRYLLLKSGETDFPSITQTYTFQPPSKTNVIHSSVEHAAIKNVDIEKFRKTFLGRMQLSVNRLSYLQRAILIRRYMTDDSIFDYEVFNELGMSERNYHRVKAKALLRLAAILNLEVFEEVGNK